MVTRGRNGSFIKYAYSCGNVLDFIPATFSPF